MDSQQQYCQDQQLPQQQQQQQQQLYHYHQQPPQHDAIYSSYVRPAVPISSTLVSERSHPLVAVRKMAADRRSGLASESEAQRAVSYPLVSAAERRARSDRRARRRAREGEMEERHWNHMQNLESVHRARLAKVTAATTAEMDKVTQVQQKQIADLKARLNTILNIHKNCEVTTTKLRSTTKQAVRMQKLSHEAERVAINEQRSLAIDVHELKEEVANTTRKLTESEQAREALESTVELLRTKNVELRDAMNEAKANVDANARVKNEMVKRTEKLMSQMEREFKKDLADMKSRMKTLSENFNQLQLESDELRFEKKQAIEAEAAAVDQLSTKDAELAKQETKTQALASRIQSMTELRQQAFRRLQATGLSHGVVVKAQATKKGVVVVKVKTDSPMAATDIQPDDIIQTIGRHRVTTKRELNAALATYLPGDTIPFTYTRGAVVSATAFVLGAKDYRDDEVAMLHSATRYDSSCFDKSRWVSLPMPNDF